MFKKSPCRVRALVTFLAASYTFAPLAFSEQVVVHENIAYKTSADLSEYERQRCQLDLYLPEDSGGFPLVLWFHGGALSRGDKASVSNIEIARSLAARGVGVAMVNYRLSPHASFPAYVDDAAASVTWVLDNIEDYRGDSDKVFVSGHSAGGYLVAMVGLDEQYLAAHGSSPSDVAGFIPISGQMVTHRTVREERDLPTARPIIDAAAPIYHVRNDAPAFLAIAGSDDAPARPEENAYFIAAMKATEHPDAAYLEIAGRNHRSIIGGIAEAGDPVAQAIIDFVAQHSGSTN